jgi:hypothetical protein
VWGEGARRRVSRSSALNLLRSRGIQAAYIFAFILFASGIVNTILEGLRPEFGGSVILPTRGAQTVSEAVINIFVMFLGLSGAFLVYRSGRQTARRRISSLYLVSGLVAMLAALLIGLIIVDFKG